VPNRLYEEPVAEAHTAEEAEQHPLVVADDVRAGRLRRRSSIANKLKEFHDMRIQDFPLANARDEAQAVQA
jgi:hypothetical protein